MFSPLDYTPEELFDANDEIGFGSERFKVGDIVYIHPDICETQKGSSITDEMVKYAGSPTVVTIAGHGSYRLDLDNEYFIWDDYCLLTQEEFARYVSGVFQGASEELLEDLI